MRAFRPLTLAAALSIVLLSGRAEERSAAPVPVPTVDAPATQAPMTLIPRDTVAAACCKVCSTGKACGNSCISRAKTCHKPPGCACDAQ
jgi:hypothetical protein